VHTGSETWLQQNRPVVNWECWPRAFDLCNHGPMYCVNRSILLSKPCDSSGDGAFPPVLIVVIVLSIILFIAIVVAILFIVKVYFVKKSPATRQEQTQLQTAWAIILVYDDTHEKSLVKTVLLITHCLKTANVTLDWMEFMWNRSCMSHILNLTVSAAAAGWHEWMIPGCHIKSSTACTNGLLTVA